MGPISDLSVCPSGQSVVPNLGAGEEGGRGQDSEAQRLRGAPPAGPALPPRRPSPGGTLLLHKAPDGPVGRPSEGQPLLSNESSAVFYNCSVIFEALRGF